MLISDVYATPYQEVIGLSFSQFHFRLHDVSECSRF